MPVIFVVALGETKVAFLPAIVAVSACALSSETKLKNETSKASERRLETLFRLKALLKFTLIALHQKIKLFDSSVLR
jgi:hypothetical protein